MADLRQVVESMGNDDVATYIQSGNIVFTAPTLDADSSTLAEELKTAIADRLAVRPSVVVRTRKELALVIRENPFAHENDHRLLHAVFLQEEPRPNDVASVRAAIDRARSKGSQDDARLISRTLYLWTPEGFAHSVLASELGRGGEFRTPMKEGTARNWRTVNALQVLLGQ